MTDTRKALESIPQGAIDALRNNQRQLDADGCDVGVSRQAIDEVLAALDAALASDEARTDATRDGILWLPIAEADKSIATIQTFGDVTLRNSYPVWVRDDDGRTYEAVWSAHKDGYWWDLVAESPVDPVEFSPHPLAVRREPRS